MTKKKILVVDDELIGRQLLQAILLVEGYETILAENGIDAIEKSNQNLPDLILMDVMMPEMNGYEVTKHLRQDKKLKNIPIILVSALEDRNSKSLGLNAGADEYISKPFDKSDILEKIKNLLSA